MAKAQNIADKKKWKKKMHLASKCGNAKCMICHSDKILGIPTRQQMRQNSQSKTNNNGTDKNSSTTTY